jgi:glycerate kinase
VAATLRAVRVVIAPDSFGGTLTAAAAAEAIAAGWRRTAPSDDLVLVAVDALDTLETALAGAGLAVTGEHSFDWSSLRGTLVTAVAEAATARAVPCVVLAERVSVGRREAAAVGIDAAYAVDDHQGGAAAALAGLAAQVARRWSR